MRKIEHIALRRRHPSLLYAKNRIHCSATMANGLIVFEKSNTLRCREGKRANCMRKIEHIVPPRRQTSQLYAKNRIHCAAAMANEPIICEKSNTLRCHKCNRANCMRKIEYIALPQWQTGSLYSKNRIHCAAAKANEPIVFEKSNTLRYGEAKRAHCMRKIEHIAPPRRQTGQLYAKNQTHCAAAKANEPIVCEKSYTLRCRNGKRAHCMRKIEHNPTVVRYTFKPCSKVTSPQK